ncbi:cupin-like domain-containing protein [Brevundimonas sp.]|uniref:cupin-like domain-containing protein n=1 Tax=Brevundimonas sp. TaxID=1871086 RepID=UPI003A923C60
MTCFAAIEERADIDLATFRDEVLPAGRPVVMRGLVSDWPAVAAAHEGAPVLAGLLRKQDVGQVMPFIVGPPSIRGRFFYNDSLEGVNFEYRQATFSEVLQALLDMVDQHDPPAIAMQSVREKDAVPGFSATHRCPVVDDDVMPRLWLGNAVTVQTHVDASQNVACVVAGRRRFTLFPPQQTRNLYVGPFEHTLAGPLVSMAPVDPPDLERYPRFAAALEVAQSAELEPGDAIYIPYMWWHHVRSLDPVSLLVNYWWNDVATARPSLLRPMEGLIAAMVSVRDLPSHQRGAWQAMFDAFVFDAGKDAGAHLPSHRRGVQGQLDESGMAAVAAAFAAALVRRRVSG